MQKRSGLFNSAILLIILWMSFGCYGQANAATIVKVALLNTPYAEMPVNLALLAEYEKSYMAGVEAAVQVAKQYGIEINYQAFFYGAGALDILSEIPKIKQWHADLVIGPTSSDQFLMLKDYLPDVMVLSPYASDINLQQLPKNFHSVSLLDSQVMQLLAAYLHKKFPTKNVYILSQADCKQCVDAGEVVLAKIKKISPNIQITEKKLIMDNIETLDAKAIMSGHTEDVILVFNQTYYAYNNIIKHLAAAFPAKKMLFFSDRDYWGSAATEVGEMNNHANYQSYRVGQVLADLDAPDFNVFEQAYYTVYHIKPVNAVSYMTYITVMSAIQALQEFPVKAAGKTIREKILASYAAALKKHPDWFRIKTYGIYRLTLQGDVLVEKLPMPK